MEFEFDSTSMESKQEKESTHYAASMSFKAGGFGWGVSGE